MISAPHGDVKHTGHVGLDGAYFGDISFLGGTKVRIYIIYVRSKINIGMILCKVLHFFHIIIIQFNTLYQSRDKFFHFCYWGFSPLLPSSLFRFSSHHHRKSILHSNSFHLVKIFSEYC